MIYRLFVNIADEWILACTVDSPDPKAAINDAVALLKPEHRGRPMRLVPEGNSQSADIAHHNPQ
jgi:hypothetical protein